MKTARPVLYAIAVFMAATAALPAAAQSVTTAFEGFNGRSNAPVNIEADRLEVMEKEEAATFTGNVVVVQGESTLRTSKLTIYYFGQASAEKNKPQSQPQAPVQGSSKQENSPLPTGRDIRRLEAEGNVVVVSREQRATGNKGIFDMGSNTVVLSGSVVVSQGQNVLRGERLVVDLTAQTSKLESTGGTGRVQGLFLPGKR